MPTSGFGHGASAEAVSFGADRAELSPQLQPYDPSHISGRVRALNLTVPLGSGRVRRSRVRAGFGLQF